MTCKYCNDTGRHPLATSVVDCLECDVSDAGHEEMHNPLAGVVPAKVGAPTYGYGCGHESAVAHVQCPYCNLGASRLDANQCTPGGFEQQVRASQECKPDLTPVFEAAAKRCRDEGGAPNGLGLAYQMAEMQRHAQFRSGTGTAAAKRLSSRRRSCLPASKTIAFMHIGEQAVARIHAMSSYEFTINPDDSVNLEIGDTVWVCTGPELIIAHLDREAGTVRAYRKGTL